MCHAVPARVIETLTDETCRVELDGVRQVVSTVLVGAVIPGDHVVVHVGFAIGRMDEAEALATLALLHERDAGEAA